MLRLVCTHAISNLHIKALHKKIILFPICSEALLMTVYKLLLTYIYKLKVKLNLEFYKI